MRKTFIILFSVAAIALFVLVVLPLMMLKKSIDDFGEQLGGGDKNYVNEQLSKAYVLEEGLIAYRPNSTGQIIAANIFSLGTVGRPEWLVGKKMTQADVGSFEVLAQNYARDNQRAYFGAAVLEGGDPASFAPVGYGYSRDDNQLWFGTVEVMDWAEPFAGEITAFSSRVFDVESQGYYFSNALVELPERPRGKVIHHCRDWFEMNGALWFAGTRFALPNDPIEVVDCDGSMRSASSVELVEENKGLLFIAGGRVYLARITGDMAEVHDFDALVETAVFFEPHHTENLLMAKLQDDRLVVVDLNGTRDVQDLGVFPDLKDSVLKRGGHRSVWLDGTFLVYNEEPSEPIYTVYRNATQEGFITLTEEKVFSSAFEVVGADPASIEVLSGSIARDRGACFVGMHYIGDLPPNEGQDVEAATDLCRAMDGASHVIYDGMRISLQKDFKRVLDGDAAEQGDEFIYDYVLGFVHVQNLTDAPLPVDKVFYDGIDAWMRSGKMVEIEVERPVLNYEGAHALAPGETVSWPLKVRSDVRNLGAGFYMSLTHVGDKKARFGDRPLRFSQTYFSEPAVVGGGD